MSNNNFLAPFKLFDAANMVFTLTSVPVNVQYMDNVGLQLAWTDTAAGLLTVECSLNYSPTPTIPFEGTWDPLTFNPALSQPAGSPGGYLINLNQLPYPWVRLKWVPTTPGVKAELVLQDLTYTAVLEGPQGNDITLTYVDDGTVVPVVSVAGTDISVRIDAGVTTANAILAAIQASAAASLLVTVVVSGTGTDAQTAESETPLADGDGEVGNLNAEICAKNL